MKSSNSNTGNLKKQNKQKHNAVIFNLKIPYTAKLLNKPEDRIKTLSCMCKVTNASLSGNTGESTEVFLKSRKRKKWDMGKRRLNRNDCIRKSQTNRYIAGLRGTHPD